jgi:hypothetical protein
VKIIYIIFSVVGWAWLVIVLGYIAWRMRADRRRSLGERTEIAGHDAK